MPPAEWKVAGQSVRRSMAERSSPGGTSYASDIDRPGMLRGKVLRPPVVRGSTGLAGHLAAEAISGVKVVRDGEFVGVVAPSEIPRLSRSGCAPANWTTPDGSHDRRGALRVSQVASRAGKPGLRESLGQREWIGQGRACGGSREGGGGLHDRLHRPCPARAPRRGCRMGWRSCDASGPERSAPSVRGRRLPRHSIWPRTSVRVLVPDTGSGYGGKHTNEAAVEAARLARGSGQAGEGGLDARRGVHLGLFPPGRADRDRGRR